MTTKITSLIGRVAEAIKFPVRRTMVYSYRTDDTGDQHLEISGLKIWIHRSGKYWVAQGLDIAYVAAGNSIADAKSLFLVGLNATLIDHMRFYHSVDRIIRPAPIEVWWGWQKDVLRNRLHHTLKTSPVKTVTDDQRTQDFIPQPKLTGCYFEPILA